MFSYLLLLVSWYAVFVLALAAHEMCHVWVADRGGDGTARAAGYWTLNPAVFLRKEPLGMVLIPVGFLVVFGWPFGFAGFPYSRDWALANPRRALAMTLAGPGANLLLATLALGCMKVGIALGVFDIPTQPSLTAVVAGQSAWKHLATLLSMVFFLNFALGLFNLLPFPPLDGGTALGLVLAEKGATGWFLLSRSPWAALGGIALASFAFVPVFTPVARWVILWLYALEKFV